MVHAWTDTALLAVIAGVSVARLVYAVLALAHAKVPTPPHGAVR